MTIKEKINTDFLEAYKNKDMFKKNFLGVIKGSIQTNEGKMIESTDENVLKLLKSIEKGLNENLTHRKKSGLDFSEQERELQFLSVYLPQNMSESEIAVIVDKMIESNGSSNVGQLMGLFNKENKGKSFDNKLVNQIISERLKVKVC